ncbi:MAG: hypothetical protein H6744_07295 [Deltaproteobacteria bacterium]|nr:hypothetical protein [Deltaproteobacteria bacterium]MCB9786484.1 hypothetical protein [Deltaproteobacteria bacterium]
MSGAWAACACLALVAAPDARPDAPAPEHSVAGVEFTVPEGAVVENLSGLPDGVSGVAVSVDLEVVMLTVYQGKGAPSEEAARSVHTEEVERQAAESDKAFQTGSFRLPVLGRNRSGREVRYRRGGVREVARVLAVGLEGRTIVAAWTVRADVSAPRSPAIVQSLRVPKR